PLAAKEPIYTAEMKVRRDGHYVKTYARLIWFRKASALRPLKRTEYQAEASATLVYHPDFRRVTDLSYIDNAFLTFRNRDRSSQVIATYNEDFSMRDATGLPFRVLGHDPEVLQPYAKGEGLFGRPYAPPYPAEKSLRGVRNDINVTANQ
ncbi:MAG: hypothetical protein AAGG46_09585, partial [Planctomycetota bacterium]